MASTYLSFTQGAATSRRIFTISVWVKRANLSAQQQIFETWLDNNNRFDVQFTASDKILVQHTLGGSTSINIETSRLFRDTSAWYHIVVEVDTTQATASDRVKIYINGVQETSFSTATYPAQNLVLRLNTASHAQSVGAYSTSSNYIDGSFAHFHQIDGIAYTPSTFGESDSTSGIWKPKTAPSVTWGTNGFFLKFENSGAFGTDSSGNANNFTVNGTMTQTIDTPSNVFATLNPLIPSNGSFSEGNNTVTTSTSTWSTVGSNLGATSGKYYWEVKMNLLSGSTTSFYTMIGFARLQGNSSDLGNNLTSNLGDNNGVGIYSDTGSIYYPGGTVSYTSSFKTSGNIIGVALDLDNNYAYWSINGTWQNSGDPTSGATGTGGYNLSSFADGSFIVPASSVQNYASANQSENEYNFGNGYFGTTAVASAGTNASGIGIFEYDVPTGYTALSTKGLNL